jgi:hypothetical protein
MPAIRFGPSSMLSYRSMSESREQAKLDEDVRRRARVDETVRRLIAFLASASSQL